MYGALFFFKKEIFLEILASPRGDLARDREGERERKREKTSFPAGPIGPVRGDLDLCLSRLGERRDAIAPFIVFRNEMS
jgi:hypothetical protein